MIGLMVEFKALSLGLFLTGWQDARAKSMHTKIRPTEMMRASTEETPDIGPECRSTLAVRDLLTCSQRGRASVFHNQSTRFLPARKSMTAGVFGPQQRH